MAEQNIEVSNDYPCKQSNLSMKLIFDILTPRPHFIIVQHKENRKLNATENEIQQVIELVSEFLLNKPQYDNNAILSFHRGKWYQQNHKHFHAHLCVPKKPYCQEAKIMITSKTTNNHWLSSIDYLNQLHKDFILSKLKYNQYQNKCILMAYLCFNDPVSYYVPLYQFNTSIFKLVFLASTPRIGIITENANIDLKILYYFMNNFYLSARKKLSVINSLYENFGVHLCLHVRGRKQNKLHLVQRFDRILVNDSDPIRLVRIVGYIQMDEQLYLRWLPTIFHQIWLNEFQNNQHLVQT
ncbi:unnamed protein product [Rotaria sp. Silwood2]|nr:unnamed protein product [Rotaria sp. Silwood2]CAF2824335.1 unnamed protein product [Rotaria sp. Silwood2]CAF2985254.1 unnamed protein product [Rotaria sp. Silwood2]CAF3882460.1 unnamed protein product [Rotaria sp. Silwood2]CAF3944984.1 unnamed protein product [Rotaria sp. Silwood2]